LKKKKEELATKKKQLKELESIVESPVTPKRSPLREKLLSIKKSNNSEKNTPKIEENKKDSQIEKCLSDIVIIEAEIAKIEEETKKFEQLHTSSSPDPSSRKVNRHIRHHRRGSAESPGPSCGSDTPWGGVDFGVDINSLAQDRSQEISIPQLECDLSNLKAELEQKKKELSILEKRKITEKKEPNVSSALSSCSESSDDMSKETVTGQQKKEPFKAIKGHKLLRRKRRKPKHITNSHTANNIDTNDTNKAIELLKVSIYNIELKITEKTEDILDLKI